MEYVLVVILILSAIFITGAVLLQNSDKEGLSGTISGKQETYYGRDKGSRLDKVLLKWTAIVAIVFAVAVFLVYVIQPDYANAYDVNSWKTLSEYMSGITNLKK